MEAVWYSDQDLASCMPDFTSYLLLVLDQAFKPPWALCTNLQKADNRTWGYQKKKGDICKSPLYSAGHIARAERWLFWVYFMFIQYFIELYHRLSVLSLFFTLWFCKSVLCSLHWERLTVKISVGLNSSLRDLKQQQTLLGSMDLDVCVTVTVLFEMVLWLLWFS